MASDKFYAYSTFNTKINEWGRVEETVQPGDEITQAKLGVSDDEWNEYVERGIVSMVPYPQNLGPGETPNEAFARENLALSRGELDEDAAKAVQARQEMQAKVANDVQAQATALATAGEDDKAAKLLEADAKKQQESGSGS